MNVAEIEEYYRGDKIPCLICYREFLALEGHIKRKHGIDSTEYKLRFDLPQSKSLSCENTKAIRRENLVRRVREGDKRMKLTKETMDKAHHSPKYQMPKYAKDALRERALINSKEILKISDDKWDEFIAEVGETGKPAWQICLLPGMPCLASVSRERKANPIFNERYLFSLQSSPKGKAAKFKATVINVRNLRDKKMPSRKIAKNLGIGKTTVNRILLGADCWGNR